MAAALAEHHIIVGDPSSPVLNAYIESDARVCIIRGPLGSGKTTGTITGKMFKCMIGQEPNPEGVRPTRFVGVRNTYRDLASTTIKDFRAGFRGLHTYKQSNIEPPTALVQFALPDGTRVESEVVFMALDREDHVSKLRGVEATFFWLNETKELIQAIVAMCDLRHGGRYPSMAFQGVRCTHFGMFGDSNSWDEDHWLYELGQDPPAGWEFFHQPGGVMRAKNPDGTKKLDANGQQVWIENPAAENQAFHQEQPGYYMDGLGGKSEAWIAVNLANEYGFIMQGVPVWPEYIDPLHCGDVELPYNPEWPIIVGIDFGRTPAAAIVQRDPVQDRYNVIDEFCAVDMSAASFGPELARYLRREYPESMGRAGMRGWGDPAGDRSGQTVETTPIQMLRAAGLSVQPSPDHTNNMLTRRTAVIAPLKRLCMDGQPALRISKKAKMIRKGAAGGFQYRKLQVAGAAKYTETPDKNAYSHPCEALEYALVGEGEGQRALRPANMYPGEEVQQWAILD